MTSLNTVSHRQIVDYWMDHEDECGLAVDWAEAQERCWRCGYQTRLQRCHIIPDSCGGSNEPSNLVLLCGRCHREAPNVQDRRFMWIWMRATCMPLYDMYWTMRGCQEFKKMFGREPFSRPEFLTLAPDHVLALMREEMRKATVHFGEGRMNPSTIASIFAMIEERVTEMPVEAVGCSSEAKDFFEAIGWSSRAINAAHGAQRQEQAIGSMGQQT